MDVITIPRVDVVGSGGQPPLGIPLRATDAGSTPPRFRPCAVRRRLGPARFPGTVAALITVVAACTGGGGGGPGAAAATTTTIVRRTPAAEVPLVSGACGDVPRLQVGGVLDPAAFVETTCEQPHTVEIGPVFDYPAGADVDFPGAGNVDGYATDECISRFADHVGTGYLTSILDFLIVAPDEDGWDDGDRRIACVLYRTDFEQLTGPVAGSGI